MSTFTFSQNMVELLADSGWSPGRNYPPADAWFQQLVSDGFSGFGMAEAILLSFGGLTVYPTGDPDRVYKPDPIHFDPFQGGSADRYMIADWEKGLDSGRLFPLGSLSIGYQLMIGSNGSLFGVSSDLCFHYGNSFEEAMEVLLLARTMPRLC